MSELLLLVLDGEDAAGNVLRELDRRTAEQADIRSCALVSIGADGRVTVTTTGRPGSESAFWGMLWEALFSLVFLVPEAGSGYGPNVGELFGALDRAGIDEHVRARIRESLGPRSSAVAMLVHTPLPTLASDLRAAYGGTMIASAVDLEPQSELAQELGVATV
jgi:uncharacterized membrane protein